MKQQRIPRLSLGWKQVWMLSCRISFWKPPHCLSHTLAIAEERKKIHARHRARIYHQGRRLHANQPFGRRHSSLSHTRPRRLLGRLLSSSRYRHTDKHPPQDWWNLRLSPRRPLYPPRNGRAVGPRSLRHQYGRSFVAVLQHPVAAASDTVRRNVLAGLSSARMESALRLGECRLDRRCCRGLAGRLCDRHSKNTMVAAGSDRHSSDPAGESCQPHLHWNGACASGHALSLLRYWNAGGDGMPNNAVMVSRRCHHCPYGPLRGSGTHRRRRHWSHWAKAEQKSSYRARR